MTKKTKAQESAALEQARVELALLVQDLKRVKREALTLARRLELAGKRAKPIGNLDGEPRTEEWWLAGTLRCVADDHLSEVVESWAEYARGVPSSKLAAAIALEARRKAKREARTARALELVQMIAAVPADPGLLTSQGRAKLQEEFRQVAHDLGWLRPCYLDTPGGEKLYREVLARHGLTPETMATACGGYYN